MMQSDDRNIKNPDSFSQKIGEKIREHQMPVDPDVWDFLEKRMPPPKKHFIPGWYWGAAAAAAVVILLSLLVVNPFNDEPLLTEKSHPQPTIMQEKDVSENRTVEKENKSVQPTQPVQSAQPEQPVQPAQPEQPVQPAQPAQPVQPVKNKSVQPAQPEVPIQPVSTAQLAQVVNPATGVDTVGLTNQKEFESRKAPSDTTRNLKSAAANMLSEEYIAENVLSQTAQNQGGFRSLIAALGSGNTPLDFSFINLESNGEYMRNFPGGDYNSETQLGSTENYQILSPKDYTDIEHRLPVSINLTAEFPIGEKVSLDAGLSYTYLYSRFSHNETLIYKGTLQQHYIGIPVNLKYKVWQNEAWNIYLLIGGSVEKGIRSIYKQKIIKQDEVVFHTSIHSKIDGLQFSGQGGVGFSYRIHKNLDLFGEPRIMYYFRNNQPISIRTENPFIFGFNLGLRLKLKSD